MREPAVSRRDPLPFIFLDGHEAVRQVVDLSSRRVILAFRVPKARGRCAALSGSLMIGRSQTLAKTKPTTMPTINRPAPPNASRSRALR